LSAGIVFGADVIYDDNLSDALVALVVDVLLSQPRREKRRFIFTAEKRYIFTLKDLRLVIEYVTRNNLIGTTRFCSKNQGSKRTAQQEIVDFV
jgi:hypothetical protein